MSDTLFAACIAGFAALTVAYLTQFVAEAYKRHKDGSAVAAAIAGELGSYAPAWPMFCDQFRSWKNAVAHGKRSDILLRPFDRPTDLVIGEMVGKLGLLGADHVEKVALVYGNIRGFRTGFEILMREHQSMTDKEFVSRCDACIAALDRSYREGEPLIRKLRARSQQRFLWPLPRVAPASGDAAAPSAPSV